jgi:hypothetical protein
MSISNSQELKQAIRSLELKKEVQEREVIDQFNVTVESLKPGNLIKSAVSKIMPVDVFQTVVKTAGSVGMGLLTSKLLGGAAAASKGKALLGGLLTQTATKTVTNNMDTIKAYGTAIIQNLFTKSNKHS